MLNTEHSSHFDCTFTCFLKTCTEHNLKTTQIRKQSGREAQSSMALSKSNLAQNHMCTCPNSSNLPKITLNTLRKVYLFFFRLDYNTICEDKHKTKAVLLCALDYLKKGGGKSQTQKAVGITISCLTSQSHSVES